MKYAKYVLLFLGLMGATAFGSNFGLVENYPSLYIAPMEGNLDGFIATEIIKQKIPVRVVMEEKGAQYIMVGTSIKADDHWYNVAFGGGKDKNEGNVRLLEVSTKRMIWAGEAGDRSLFGAAWRRGGERKVADRIIRQLKDARIFTD